MITCFSYQVVQVFPQSLQQAQLVVESAESIFPFNEHLYARPCGKYRAGKKRVKIKLLSSVMLNFSSAKQVMQIWCLLG